MLCLAGINMRLPWQFGLMKLLLGLNPDLTADQQVILIATSTLVRTCNDYTLQLTV